MCGALYRLIRAWLYGAPAPATAFFGFRWQAGAGVPGAFQIYDQNGLAGGLYVVFNADLLDGGVDPFGRAPLGPGPLFVAPGGPSAAMTTLITTLRNNPPPTKAYEINNASPQRLADMTGFFGYVDRCLTILNATAAGAALLGQLTAAPQPIFIVPGAGLGNQTASGGVYVNSLVTQLKTYEANGTLPSAELRAAVDAKYALLGAGLPRYNQLAADLNGLDFVSLFVDQNLFAGNFLLNNFDYNGAPMTGNDLMIWLAPGGLPAFDAWVRTIPTVVLGVEVKQFFLLALSIVLYDVSAAGPGAGSGISFMVRDEGDNQLGSPGFRAPVIGLAHELMHALHNAYGNAAGLDIYDWSTTANEMLNVGIGPFAAQAITENAIRNQYNALAAMPVGPIDPTNVWVAVQRDTYEPPVLPDTPTTLRGQMRCI